MPVSRDLSIAPKKPETNVDPAIVRGIRQASKASNVDFGYLMAQAQQESSFRPDAKSSSSSATGLYQFIDSTWLDMVRRHGAQHGLAPYADAITVDNRGRTSVADPAMRQKILDLRTDPKVSASLAAEFAKENKVEVEKVLGRKARSTDLYLAHFLGAGGASEFLKTVEKNGSVAAADLLPEAANANRSVFFDSKTGAAKSVAEIYRNFADKIEKTAQQFAGAVGEPSGGATSSVPAGTSIRLPATRSTFDVSSLDQPTLAMFNIIALSAMKLLHGTASGTSDRSLAASPSLYQPLVSAYQRRDASST